MFKNFNVVISYFQSKQILPFGFIWQCVSIPILYKENIKWQNKTKKHIGDNLRIKTMTTYYGRHVVENSFTRFNIQHFLIDLDDVPCPRYMNAASAHKELKEVVSDCMWLCEHQQWRENQCSVYTSLPTRCLTEEGRRLWWNLWMGSTLSTALWEAPFSVHVC